MGGTSSNSYSDPEKPKKKTTMKAAASEQNKSREPASSACTDTSDGVPTWSRIMKLEGTNAGSSMTTLDGGSNGGCGCGSINIYINNNIQGVNNSILSGSEVKVGSPGLSVSFGDVGLGCGTRKKRAGNRCGSRIFMFASVFLFLFPFLVGLFAGPIDEGKCL